MTITIQPSEIKSLVPMPVSVVELSVVATDLDANVDEITRIIEHDPALTANLLKVANSVWGRAMQPISTVKDVVVRLGSSQILKFCIGIQIAGPMSEAMPGYNLGEHALWRHSLASAIAAEFLNGYLQQPVSRLAFTASLMHDIGKILLNNHLTRDIIQEIHRLLCDESIPFIDAERRVLGTDHAEVGGSIARYWNFPKPLVDAIELHHDPDKDPSALLYIIHLSNILAKRICSNAKLPPEMEEMMYTSAEWLGISSEDTDEICELAVVELDKAEKAYVM